VQPLDVWLSHRTERPAKKPGGVFPAGHKYLIGPFVKKKASQYTQSFQNHETSILAGTRSTPLPCRMNFPTHVCSSEKGGFTNTLPRHGKSKPLSCGYLYSACASFSTDLCDPHGSRSNSPIAFTMYGGVRKSSLVFSFLMASFTKCDLSTHNKHGLPK